MTMDEFDKDLRLLTQKFSLEELEKIRINIINLLDTECDRRKLSDNQTHLLGFEIVQVLFEFYSELISETYSIDPKNEILDMKIKNKAMKIETLLFH